VTETTRIIVGGAAEDDAAAFVQAWKRSEAGEDLAPDRVIAFESWEGLTRVLTGQRYRLLRWLKANPEPSVSSLARSLHRQFRRVHADVCALEEAGLIERTKREVRTTADRIQADIQL
jgi:predicted transcriptional regulator